MIPLLAFHPPVIAHRGAGLIAPENTLEAVKEAKQQGARWIEIDVKITYDGVPILMHDETVDRTTTGTGLIAEMTWEAVQALDAGIKFGNAYRGVKVPSLSDTMKAVVEADMDIVVEMKPCPGRSKATTMVTMFEMSKVWPEKDRLPVISSFDVESLEIAAQLEPHWPRCLLLDSWVEDWKARFEQVEGSAVAVSDAALTPERVDELNHLRIPLLAYTVNDPQRAKELLAWGVAAVYAGSPRAILDVL